MIFALSIRDKSGLSRDLEVEIFKPVRSSDTEAWECVIRWRGGVEGQTKAFGATSIQSLSLALEHLRFTLPLDFPGCTFTENGLPWL